MIKFHIDQFPNFYEYAKAIAYSEEKTKRRPTYDEIMRREGYEYAMIGEPGCGWVMDDADYTFFILRWS
jgi:hypothetical protein